jgi:dihydroflavonol-4-reductase
MKIGVTGASGHVGSNLCRMLINQGYQVKALIHNSTKGLTGLNMDFIKGDVTCESDLVNLCSGCDAVFHLAAYISIWKTDPLCKKINVESCIKLIRAARTTGLKKIIHFSSIHAFRQIPLDAELNETRELSINSAVSYDQSKALGQRIMMEASSKDLEIIVINPTAVFGPNDFKPSLLGNALIRFYKGQNPVLIPGGYNWVDVRDVCATAIKALKYGIGGECYLLGGSWQNLITLSRTIENLGGHKAPGLELPMWVVKLGAPLFNLRSFVTHKAPLYTAVSLETLKNSHRNISCEKAASVLGYTARPFSETLTDTLTWFRENNYV